MSDPRDPHLEEGYFSARDGVRLFWQTSRPQGAPAAHVALLHGYAEHLGRHSEITRALVKAGYAVHLADARGHGHSGGKRAHVDRFDDYLGDLDLFLQRVRGEAEGRAVFLAGHSHGALVAARYLLDRPEAARGAVLASPYFGLMMRVSPMKIWAGKLMGRALPGLPMSNEVQPEQLTRDVAIQQATRADPLYQHIATPRWFTESSAAQETVLRRAPEFRTPFLALCGGADPIADPAAGREFFERAGSADKQFKHYDGLLHELFHEPERDLVFGDVIAWLDARARGVSAAGPRVAAGSSA